jgi:hypothetical protein
MDAWIAIRSIDVRSRQDERRREADRFRLIREHRADRIGTVDPVTGAGPAHGRAVPRTAST